MFTGFELPTPALLIEKNILENNIAKMQDLADSALVKLRPHIKTHKSIKIAKMQLAAGASGIACAKLSEAEKMAEGGIYDIQIANVIIGDDKIKRLLELHRKIDNLSCCIDSYKGAKDLGEAFSTAGRTLEVFIKIDSGLGRLGLRLPEEAYEMASFIHTLDGLHLKGILTHAGQAYSAQDPKNVRIIGLHEGNFMSEMYQYLKNNKIELEEVSVGSTPTAEYCIQSDEVTELRAGNYVFHDMIQVSLGSCSPEDCALSVLATVISTPETSRAVIDAGSKSLGLDRGAHSAELLRGFGSVYEKNGEIERVSEEHGVIIHDSVDYEIGEKIRIIPNHACAVVNLYDKAYLVDGEDVVEEIKIDARGCIT